MIKEQKNQTNRRKPKDFVTKKNNLLRNILIPPRIFGEQ